MIGTIIGISVAALSHYLFIPIEGLHLLGAVIGIILMELIVTTMNLIELKRVIGRINIDKLLINTLIVPMILVPAAILTQSIGIHINWGHYSALPGMFLYLLLVSTYLLIRYRPNV
ncbi:hypothetical protein RE628_14530 [Paenibacillus sp. D2_2]|uniref:hypothetical protein n=1 Tax=Paenibacillus sp. D2_2 TaxID=3073092 RepID=UPI0028159B26|nr:hypothetical protein [Paenibacillus sp. D2_2]WMT43346.1 hypothetical protein RE628_14530 [Paenibacillus sp. D2_2]